MFSLCRLLYIKSLGRALAFWNAFLRGLPHQSTVRGFRGFFRVPHINLAQWNNTLAGCLGNLSNFLKHCLL